MQFKFQVIVNVRADNELKKKKEKADAGENYCFPDSALLL